jgi:hypothetical protein
MARWRPNLQDVSPLVGELIPSQKRNRVPRSECFLRCNSLWVHIHREPGVPSSLGINDVSGGFGFQCLHSSSALLIDLMYGIVVSRSEFLLSCYSLWRGALETCDTLGYLCSSISLLRSMRPLCKTQIQSNFPKHSLRLQEGL